MWLRILSLCVVLACTETLHGIFRTVVVTPRLGKQRAIRLSALTGTLLALLVCRLLVPGIGLTGWAELLVLGLGLATFMAAFDISLGLWLLRKPWRKVMLDFDPRTGNWLLFGLMALVTLPALAMLLHARA